MLFAVIIELVLVVACLLGCSSLGKMVPDDG